MPGTDWDHHYQDEFPPWEGGEPSSELARIIAERNIRPCRVVDLGCGSGINSVWLAQHGFDVTAIDFNLIAIGRARNRASAAGVKVQLFQTDLLDLRDSFAPFPIFFDRGCYHAVRRIDANAYVRTLQRLTAPGSVGLILTGNAKEPHEKGKGPPVVSADEIRAELGSAFEIVRLREFHFDLSKRDVVPILGWSCLLRRT